MSAGGLSACDSGYSPDSCQTVLFSPTRYFQRTDTWTRGGMERREPHGRKGRDGPLKKSANNATPPPRRPVSRAWREERGNSLGIMQPYGAAAHTPPKEGGGDGTGRGTLRARQVGAQPGCLPPGSARKAEEGGGRAAPSRPAGQRGAKPARGRSAAPKWGGHKPGPPAPTAPPDRLHLSPATAEGGKRRGGCAPRGERVASSGCRLLPQAPRPPLAHRHCEAPGREEPPRPSTAAGPPTPPPRRSTSQLAAPAAES